MMGNKSDKAARLHHNQVDNARAKKLGTEVQRIISFEVNKAGIKARLEAKRQQFIIAGMVFLIGLGLVLFGLAYIVGVVLYG